ncbi:sigma-70 family RNA polymerase sigma factor [Acidimangrovimonas pyrenivorans]|uniref:Sigma-70 family RNA polymerase sigma factor n=1 Tax=Acidimangrovimonas pyrenivorans TaxID=2030798 RepID=A0ABV7AIE9_9RHOB
MKILDEIEAAIPALRRYAGALVRDRDAADDLVQDCLERAVARRGDWRGQGPVRAWLFRILLNRHRDLRRAAPRPGHLVPVEGLFPEPSAPPPQDGHLALTEVRAAMERLPEEQRQALLLVVLEGLSFEAAAEALEIPKGTLMSRLARARANLRALTGREAKTKGRSR